MTDEKYYLMDLERTIGISRAFYWRANKRGYTTLIEEAGLYSFETASQEVEGDFNKRTIMVSQKTVEGILKL